MVLFTKPYADDPKLSDGHPSNDPSSSSRIPTITFRAQYLGTHVEPTVEVYEPAGLAMATETYEPASLIMATKTNTVAVVVAAPMQQ